MRHTLLLCLLIGCGIAQEDFPDEAAEAWCKRADKCGELPDGQDRDECQAAVSASVDFVIDGAAILGAEYNSAGAGACVREIRSLTCDELLDWNAGDCDLFD